MEEAAFQDAPAFTVSSKKSPKRFIYLVIGIIVLILIFVFSSRFLFSSKKEIKKTAPTPTIVEKITSAPTSEISGKPTPAPTTKPTNSPVDKKSGLNRSKLNVEVQNGSGVVGAAGKVAEFLKSLDYSVIGTENADNFDYTGVTITVKSGSADYGELLKSDLGSKYTVSSTLSDLSATASPDAIIIVGK